MGKGLRILLGILGTLVLVIVIAAVVLPLIIDPNQFKDDIAQVVHDKTGRDLHIGGEIGLSVFPWLSLDVSDISLSNAPGFGETPFAQVDQVEVGVRLLPLLSKEVEMSTLTLKGLQLHLARNAQGRTNWEDLTAQAPAEPAKAREQKPGGGGAPALAALAIDGVSVSDARVVWDDAQSGQRYSVDDLDLSLGAIGFDEDVPLQLEVAFSGTPPLESATLELHGSLRMNEGLSRFEVKDLALRMEAEGEDLPGKQLAATLDTGLSLDLDAQRLQIPSLVAKAAGLELRGKLHGSGVGGDAPRFTGHLETEQFSPRAVIEELGQAVPETSDPEVLTKARLELDFDAGTDDAEISDLALALDDSSLSGSAGVRGFADPDIRFQLALDQIDLDRYLPPRSEAPPATPAEAAAGGAAQLPMETLRALKLNGQLTIAKLHAFQLNSRDILLKVTARDGRLRLHPAQAKLYQGSYQGDIGLDARGDEPEISLNEKLSGVQAGPLLKDMLGEERLSGEANVAAKLTATGIGPEQVKQTLNGTARFAFTDGAVKGINVAALIRKAQAAIKGQAAPAQQGPEQTDFTELTGSATITNGLVRNDDLSARSPLLRINGKGEVSLPYETINYLLTTKIVGSLEGQGGAGLKDLRGVAIPVKITGTFAEPKFGVQLDEAVKEAAKTKVKEKVEEKVQEKLKDKLGNDVQDKLKGLFGR